MEALLLLILVMTKKDGSGSFRDSAAEVSKSFLWLTILDGNSLWTSHAGLPWWPRDCEVFIFREPLTEYS